MFRRVFLIALLVCCLGGSLVAVQPGLAGDASGTSTLFGDESAEPSYETSGSETGEEDDWWDESEESDDVETSRGNESDGEDANGSRDSDEESGWSESDESEDEAANESNGSDDEHWWGESDESEDEHWWDESNGSDDEDTNDSGREPNDSDEDANRSDEDANRSDEDANRSDEDANRSDGEPNDSDEREGTEESPDGAADGGSDDQGEEQDTGGGDAGASDEYGLGDVTDAVVNATDVATDVTMNVTEMTANVTGDITDETVESTVEPTVDVIDHDEDADDADADGGLSAVLNGTLGEDADLDGDNDFGEDDDLDGLLVADEVVDELPVIDRLPVVDELAVVDELPAIEAIDDNGSLVRDDEGVHLLDPESGLAADVASLLLDSSDPDGDGEGGEGQLSSDSGGEGSAPGKALHVDDGSGTLDGVPPIERNVDGASDGDGEEADKNQDQDQGGTPDGDDGGEVPSGTPGEACALLMLVGYLGGPRLAVNQTAMLASAGQPGLLGALQQIVGFYLGELGGGLIPPVFGYSRHDGSDPLENETRARLFELVRDSPGMYYAQLAEETDVTEETVRYHSRILADEGLVERRKFRGRQRLYPVSMDDGDPELAAAMADSAASDVLSIIERREPTTLSAVADDLECAPSTVAYHLDRLEDDGLVTRERDGGSVRIRLRTSTRSALKGSVADD